MQLPQYVARIIAPVTPYGQITTQHAKLANAPTERYVDTGASKTIMAQQTHYTRVQNVHHTKVYQV